MPANLHTVGDVVSWIVNEGTAGDINQIVAACNERNKQLRAAAAARAIAELKAGDAVELYGLRPKYLNGLTGTFVDLDTRANKTTAVIQLDDVSRLQAGPRYVSASGRINAPTSAVRRVVNA